LSTIRQYKGTSFGTLFKAGLAAVSLPDDIPYEGLQPLDIGTAHYQAEAGKKDFDSLAFESYFKRFFNKQLGFSQDGPFLNHDLLILLPMDNPLDDPASLSGVQQIIAAARKLQTSGARVLMIGPSRPRLTLMSGLLFLGVPNKESRAAVLDALRQAQDVARKTKRASFWKLGRLTPDDSMGGTDTVVVFNDEDQMLCSWAETVVKYSSLLDSQSFYMMVARKLRYRLLTKSRLLIFYFQIHNLISSLHIQKRLKNYISRPGYYLKKMVAILRRSSSESR
jgi:hypothetical protein